MRTIPTIEGRFQVDSIMWRLLAAAHRSGFVLERYGTQDRFGLYGATRINSTELKTVYLSSGMHGDEPAGPLAILKILEDRILPLEEFNWTICPMLNPVGLRLSQRENGDGIDLNRDYRSQTTDEVRSHIRWLERQPPFDLALLLHEDWETRGFYLHECQICDDRKKVEAIMGAVSSICSIDLESVIDGMHASGGIVHPWRESKFRNQWLESFYLKRNKAAMGFIFETPSSIDLPSRIKAHIAATLAALDLLRNDSPSLKRV